MARRLGWAHLDSGALYRALTLAALDNLGEGSGEGGGAGWGAQQVIALAEDLPVRLVLAGDDFRPEVAGVDVADAIRSDRVTRRVSELAAIPAVRQWVNAEQRAAAAGHPRGVVVDGRDIGTVVFPDAELKVFLVADPWERARRRLIQRLDRHPSEDEIAVETDALVQRDAKDATQTVQATDAILVDTTYLTQEEQVERIVALAKAVTRRPDKTSAVDG